MMTKIKILCAMLYTLLAVGANPLTANTLDVEALREIRKGDMRLVSIHTKPKPAVSTPFQDVNGDTIDLTAYTGKIVLLNFWATWCAPCRAEMPSLDALNKEIGGDHFEVVTIAVGRNSIPVIKQFFEDNNITSLPIQRDPKMKLAGSVGVRGLPATLILNLKGQEIARIQREADWNSLNARNLLNAIIKPNF